MIIMGLVGILVMVAFILLLGYIGGIIAIYAANRQQQKEIEEQVKKVTGVSISASKITLEKDKTETGKITVDVIYNGWRTR